MDIHSRNKSPYGWWVATLIERFQFDHEDLSNPRRRCRAFTNVVILKADNREQAYKKAIEYGNLAIEDKSNWEDDKGRKGRWIFEIDPDGTEIFFEDDRNVTVGRVQSWVRPKSELEAFDDSDSNG
jgi:hypothetical protein